MEFKYKAKNASGEIQEGIISANNTDEATVNLQKQGLFVLEIKSAKGDFSVKGFSFKKKVSLKDKIIFTNQLAMMTKGGLPLVEALKGLAEEAENEEFKKALNKIVEDITGGMALSKAMEKHPKIFPSLYTSIVASGEKSGKLSEVLERLTDQYQKDYNLISKVKSAVSYPVVIVIALVGVLILMLILVVPNLKKIFSEMGVELPLTTRILIGASDFAVHFWYIVIVALIGLYFLIRWLVATPKGGILIDKFKVKVFIFGPLVKKIYMARFCRTTGTLVAAGLPMLDVLNTVKKVVNNKYYEPYFTKIAQEVESGIPLSVALKKQKIFTNMIAQMLAVGEKSGKVDEVLFHLADFYDQEVDNATSSLTSMIEPILIIVIGGAIGVAISSIIMPIYKLTDVIK